jgi:hypothetical protein
VRLLPLTLLLALATATASAQGTWRGLHFGESRDSVNAQFTNLNMPSTTSQDGSVQVNADYELPLPGLRYPFPMIVTAHFDDHGGLSDVTLALDLSSAHHYWANIGSDEALLNFAAQHFTSAISGRYGAPLFTSNACDAEPKQPPTFCIVSWSSPSQTIEIERAITARGPHLLIRYQPLASDL